MNIGSVSNAQNVLPYVSTSGNGTSCTDTSESEKSVSDPETFSKQTSNQHSLSKETVELSDEEKRQVAELSRRDREVRAHEAAHMAAGGGHVRGGAQFSYQTGPDGKRYAVGGEVSIDTSTVRDNPEATIRKMQTVRKAALAPANPSGQDRSVAAAASAKEAQARQELQAEKTSEQKDDQQTGQPKITRGYSRKGTVKTDKAIPELDIAA